VGELDPRKMAVTLAGIRARETHLPEDERICNDPYAELFLSDEMREDLKDLKKIRATISTVEQMLPGVNGSAVARIRFIDEYLLECVASGFKQLVIIGAGFDTRAYRFKEVKENLRVFEVDHPKTQQVKVDKVKEIFGALPDHVIYVPVVFGIDPLDRKLLENNYNPKLKTVFIAEGLLMYIPPPAVDGLLSFVADTSGPGSTFVADYFPDSVIDGTSTIAGAQALRQFVESEGSPLQFGIKEGTLEEFFKQRGFHEVTNVTSSACKEKYFKNASRDRTVSLMFNFVRATLPPRDYPLGIEID